MSKKCRYCDLWRKMRGFGELLLCLAVVGGVSSNTQRIVGGYPTTISHYPSIAALLRTSDLQTYWQSCAGTVVTPRSILTAAHCTVGWQPINWQARVGSTYAHSGGVVHAINTITTHPYYNSWTTDNDIAIICTVSTINYVSNAVEFAWLAGSHYILKDDEEVWAAGWGTISYGGQASETLRDVQVWTVNQETCRNNYVNVRPVTSNMLCSGYLGVGGRDQCHGDSGGPLYHNGIVVGICSWGLQCALPDYPGVNTRVSRYTAWIQSNV